MTRPRCLDCQDDRHCRHTGYLPAGMILAACRCLDCDPEPIQARLFSHALVETMLRQQRSADRLPRLASGAGLGLGLHRL
jgi:hypothetical protein